MRPDPQFPPKDESPDRIIYLGDVRRRRARRKRSPDLHYLVVLALIALAAWLVWGVVLLNVAPSKLLSYLAFLVPLAVAAAATGSLVAYWAEWRAGYLPDLVAATRRGALAAAVAVFNLAVLATHRWTIVVGGISLLLALGTELALSRRR